MSETKACAHCKETLPVDRFYKKRENSYQSYCKDCTRVRYGRSEGRREIARRHYYKLDPEVRRDRRLRSYFGLSIEAYNAMLVEQGGVCAICGGAETRTHRKTGAVQSLSVDHDHTTGLVRGLLCGACNTAIGHMQDDPDRLLKAAHYLRASVVA